MHIEKTFLLSLFLFSTLYLISCTGKNNDSKQAMHVNVILISIDTLRYDHLGVYGYIKPTSPNIDAFAKDSLVFAQAIAHAPSTLPSHASILTSLIPSHHNASVAQKLPVSEHIETLAEILKKNGYATASFNGGIQLDKVWGLAQGFDVYDSVKEFDSEADTLSGSENSFNAILQKAFKWIRSSRRPFFVFLHSYETHHPYTPLKEFLSEFEEVYNGYLPEHISVNLLKKINNKELAISTNDIQHILNTYDAEIRSMDEAFGSFIRFLKVSGDYDNTLIIFTSDHGEEFGEHGIYGWHSHTLYDELLRIPLIIKLPFSKLAGLRLYTQVRGIDIAPTILQYLKIKQPTQFEGVDLLSCINKSNIKLPTFVMQDTPATISSKAVRINGWKLYNEKLFNLTEDPREQNDVIKQYPQMALYLRTLLEEQMLLNKKYTAQEIKPKQKLIEQLHTLGYID